MIKYFKVKNFLSFKDETEINFESSKYGGKKENVFDINSTSGKVTLEKSMLIYGANASGKTNILRALAFIKRVALVSSETINTPSPFLLDSNNLIEPSYFEICFFIEKKEFIYNFTIFNGIIINENLIESKKKNPVYLYKRTKSKITYDKSFEKEAIKGLEKVKDNISFFAVLSQWNGKLNKKPIDTFFRKLNILLSNNIASNITVSILNLLSSERNKEIVLEFLRCADINIDDIAIVERPIPDELLDDTSLKSLDRVKRYSIKFGHKVNNSNEVRFFDLSDESSGTQKLFCILGPIIDSILNEKVLFVDEIEANLHPHILKNIFKLIHSDINKKYQFIFTTHSLELMNLSMFKKEQIGIVQKNNNLSSEFYTLYDFENIRSENDIKKMYNIGNFGGVPNVGDFSILIKEIQLGEKN